MLGGGGGGGDFNFFFFFMNYELFNFLFLSVLFIHTNEI